MDPDLNTIVAALDSIHSAQASNDVRLVAQNLLEEIKGNPTSPLWGFRLATDAAQPDIVRHFALSLLENAIRWHYLDYSKEQRLQLRQWIVEIGMTGMKTVEVHYISEKIALLWSEVAKREWGAEWRDLDSRLVELWGSSAAKRELALGILRNLVEDTFHLDDAVADLRHATLTDNLNAIFNSADILQAHFGSIDRSVKHDESGWLQRVTTTLCDDCFKSNNDRAVNGTADRVSLATKILYLIKICLPWVYAKSIQEAGILDQMTTALTTDNVPVMCEATDALHVLFVKPFIDPADFNDILLPALSPSAISFWRQIYERTLSVDVDTVDDPEYTLVKKYAECICSLGECILSQPSPNPLIDLASYTQLLLMIARHPSPLVSYNALLLCSKFVKNLTSDPIMASLEPLLEVCGDRLASFELIEYPTPEQAIMLRFLDADFDSLPERHAFAGNFRRVAADLVRIIVSMRPVDAIQWIQVRMSRFLDSKPDGSHRDILGFCRRSSPAYIAADALFLLVESALKGVKRWEQYHPVNQHNTTSHTNLLSGLEEWCRKLVGSEMDDPLMLSRHIAVLVSFITLLRSNPQLMFTVLEKVLVSSTFAYPADASNELFSHIRELRGKCGAHLLRIAEMMPDALLSVYDQLESSIDNLLATKEVSDSESASFRSFLLTVVLRSSCPRETKVAVFSKIVDPVVTAWQDPQLDSGVASLQNFVRYITLDEIAGYLESEGLKPGVDIESIELGPKGYAMRQGLRRRWMFCWPIKATRLFLQTSMEGGSDPVNHAVLTDLWRPRIPSVLPNLFALIRCIQAFYNPDNWSVLPSAVQILVRIVVVERFWQHGVSSKTKDEFMDKKANTGQDFTDAIQGFLKYSREYACVLLAAMTLVGETFYSQRNLAQNIVEAFFADQQGMSLNTWRTVLNSLMHPLIVNCPSSMYEQFLQPLLISILHELDAKLVAEWDRLSRRGLLIVREEEGEDSQDLSDEMMEESLLRQMSGAGVKLLLALIGPAAIPKDIPAAKKDKETAIPQREFLLTNNAVLEKFLPLCTRLLTIHDTRSCSSAIRIFRSILPELVDAGPEVKTYICTQIFRSALEAMHDPYFSELQRDIAYVITVIYVGFSDFSLAPRETLASVLPEARVAKLHERLETTRSQRTQRSVILEALESIKGVPRSEMGRREVDLGIGEPAKLHTDGPNHGNINVEIGDFM